MLTGHIATISYTPAKGTAVGTYTNGFYGDNLRIMAGQKNVTINYDLKEKTSGALFILEIQESYTVTWKNWDGTVLETDEDVPYGTLPSYDGETPTRVEEGITYTFDGWDPEVAEVTADAVYTAKFTSSVNTYTVTFNANGGTGSMDPMSFSYDEEKTLTANAFTREDYHFIGWNTQQDGSGTTYTDQASVKNLTTENNVTVTLYAQWTQNPVWTVTFAANNGTDAQTTQSVPEAIAAQLAANTFSYEGYRFSKWNTKADGSGTDFAADAYVTLYADLTLYAQWTAVSYEIRYELNGGALADGVTNPANYTIESSAVTLNNPTKTGYTFVGWTGTGLTEPSSSVTIPAGSTGNREYTATWTALSYEIRYDLDGGALADGVTNPEIYTIESGAITLNNPTKTGYTFAGWTGTGLTSATQTVTIPAGSTGDREYTATWRANRYTVAFSANGGTGTMDPMSFSYDEEKTLTANAFTREGYHFLGWNTQLDGSGTTYTNQASVKNLTTEDNATVTLYAQWTQNPVWTVTFIANNGTADQTAQSVPDSVETALAANTFSYEGHSFSRWNTSADGSGTDYADNASVTLNADLTLYAQWTVNTYTVTWKNYDGTVLETDENVPYGAMPSYDGEEPVHEPEEGVSYVFDGWDPEVTKVTGDAVYTAKFTGSVNTYTVTWKNYDGAVLETDENVPYGAMPSYDGPEPTREDPEGRLIYTFVGWDPAVTAVTGDAEYTALFTSDGRIYQIKVTSNEYGTAYALPEEGQTGTEVTLFATPKANCQFVKWVVVKGDVTVNDDKFVIMYSDVEIQAVFEAIENPFDMEVTIYNIMDNGKKGAPEDIADTHLDPTLILMSVEHETSGKFNGGFTVHPKEYQIKTTVTFANEVPDISSALYEVIAEGLPKLVSSAGKEDNKYLLTSNAWINSEGGITLNLIWTDKNRVPDNEVYVFPLPEDEIGAYKMDPWGKKEYLIFHTYDICMRWLGDDGLCSGYERCFHKELPYIYDKNKIRYGYDWQQP